MWNPRLYSMPYSLNLLSQDKKNCTVTFCGTNSDETNV